MIALFTAPMPLLRGACSKNNTQFKLAEGNESCTRKVTLGAARGQIADETGCYVFDAKGCGGIRRITRLQSRGFGCF